MKKINKSDKEFIETFNITCIPQCPYFPDMSVRDGEWEEKDGIKKRKQEKIFRCLYDNHILNWTVPCPRAFIKSYKEKYNG